MFDQSLAAADACAGSVARPAERLQACVHRDGLRVDSVAALGYEDDAPAGERIQLERLGY